MNKGPEGSVWKGEERSGFCNEILQTENLAGGRERDGKREEASSISNFSEPKQTGRASKRRSEPGSA